jgi:hypothetical protein
MMAWSRFAASLVLLLAASCGSEQPVTDKSPEQLRREIEALSTPPSLKKEVPKFRLRPLTLDEVRSYAGEGPVCLVLVGERVLFVTNGNQGLARIDGRLARLTASGPVGPSGGFFAAEGATLSIGRIGQYAGEAAAYAPSWTAIVAIGGAARGVKPQQFDAGWTCRRRLSQ